MRRHAVPRSQRGLYRPHIVRAALRGHSILGIAFAAAIYLICLTGTLSVFERDWERWEQPGVPGLEAVSDHAVARAVHDAEARLGPGPTLYVTLPDGDLPRVSLLAYRGEQSTTWFADGSGRIVASRHTPWADFVAQLHLRLHLPRALGSVLVGLIGVGLLATLISGVLSHPRIVRDAFHLRIGGARRLEQADLHNRLGVWALPFHLLVALTGATLGLFTILVSMLALLAYKGDSSQVYSLLYGPPPIADAQAAPMPDVTVLMATARQRMGGAVPRSLIVSNWGRKDARFSISAMRARLIAAQDHVTFDVGGRVVDERHPADATLGEKGLGAFGPLHFGWFGGATIRIAYGCLGLALCVVTSSGVSVWLARRRDQGRPKTLFERLWAAMIWGQPCTLAVVCAASLIAPPSVLAPLWLGTTCLLLGVAAVAGSLSAASLAHGLRLATGIAILLAVMTHLAVHGVLADRTGGTIDAIAAFAGLALAGPFQAMMRRK